MRLTSYMDRKLILLDLPAASKEEAIAKIVGHMRENQAIEDVDAVLEEIFSRESRGGTSLGNGVAIPHARVRGIDRITVAMARLAEGVKFSEEDRQPVRMVFVVITPLEKLNEYLKVLAGLAKFMKDKKMLKRLLAADSLEGAWELFDSLEPEDE